jgi:hypothetical protein
MARQTWQWLGGALLACGVATHAATLVEDFTEAPSGNGWVALGDPSLFQWDREAGVLGVTWDSARANSYFAHPLGTTLRKTDDFALEFDLQLQEVQVGTTAGKPYTFQLAVGFMNLAQATQTNYWRGTGMDSPNLVEFDYFPDSGFGATVSPTFISTSGQFASGFTFPVELATGSRFHVAMTYTASNRTLTTRLTQNGTTFAAINDVVLGADFGDIAVDHVAVMSYSDAAQDPMFAGSVRARGIVDNLAARIPDVPIRSIAGTWAEGRYTVPLAGMPGWRYTLERTTDWSRWDAVAGPIEGAGERQILVDTAPHAAQGFYRVRAEKP